MKPGESMQLEDAMNSRLKIGVIAVLGAAVGLATPYISRHAKDVIAIKPALAAGGTV